MLSRTSRKLIKPSILDNQLCPRPFSLGLLSGMSECSRVVRYKQYGIGGSVAESQVANLSRQVSSAIFRMFDNNDHSFIREAPDLEYNLFATL